jgi:hypothetical protein
MARPTPSSCDGSSWSRHAREELGLEHLHVLEQLSAGGGDADEDDATVAGDADPFHEPALLDPVDEAGGRRQRHVKRLGQPAHRQLAVPLEQVQYVQLRHADAHPQKSFAPDALSARPRSCERRR